MTDVFWGKEFMMKISLFGHSRTNMLDTPVFISDLQRAVVLDTFFFLKPGVFLLPLPVKGR